VSGFKAPADEAVVG
jgi:hypothetical protein